MNAWDLVTFNDSLGKPQKAKLVAESNDSIDVVDVEVNEFVKMKVLRGL
jgi:hypothetical protein